MKIFLQNTATGLVPLYDEDYEEKRKLKIGQVYQAEIKQPRNYQFHKLYFALINCAWEYLRESDVEKFKNVDNFRKAVQIEAGYFELLYVIELEVYVKQAVSISFGKMDEIEFNQLYERVKDVIFKMLRYVPIDEFERNLSNFM